LDDIYQQEDYGIEMDYGEEEEEFRGSNGFSGNYDLDIIQENPDDEAEASGSKQESPPMHETQKMEVKHASKMAKRPSSKKKYISVTVSKEEDSR
jgi:hypothetical protein